MAPGPAKRTLLFLHVPKAGGTALGGVLGNRFAADECLSIYYDDDPDDDALNAARYVVGHVSMSVLDRFDRPPFTITLLREPIERALSMYSYFRAFDRDDESRLRFGGGLERFKEAVRLAKQHSIDQFIRVAPDLGRHYLGNWQARMLGGSSLGPTGERLEDALAGMHRCDFVGLAERPDESAEWLALRLGWSELSPLPLTNVTRTRLRSQEVSPAAMDALLELTSVDRNLYAQAVRLYESRLAEWSSAADVKDHGAEIDDARAVGDLRFGDRIRGSGWLGRERIDGQPHFCWIGHTATARVDLAGDGAARSVTIEIAHVLDPATLGTLQISVNGETVPHRLAESAGTVIASAPLERLRRRGPVVRVELAVDHTTRPRDVNPSTSDNRELGIAVQRVALTRDLWSARRPPS